MAKWRRKRGQRTSSHAADALLSAAAERGTTVISATAAEAEDTAIAFAQQLYEQGRPDAAEQGLSVIVADGSPAAVGRAAASLGIMREDRGDIAGAEDAYRSASASPDWYAAALGALNLSVIKVNQGAYAEAETLLHKAMDAGHPEASPKAAHNLGGLLAMLRRRDEAIPILQRAIDSGHPDESPGALKVLGIVLYHQGRISEAEAAFIKVIQSGHPEFAPVAQACLLDLRRQYRG